MLPDQLAGELERPRRPFQFSLRKLFWLTAVAGLLVSPLAFKATVLSVVIYTVLSGAIMLITVLVLLIALLGILLALAALIRGVIKAATSARRINRA